MFQIFLGGDSGSVISHSSKRPGTPLDAGIVAVDMDQPVNVLRRACRHITFMVPASHVTPVFADPGILHGRVLASALPAVRLIVARANELLRTIRSMPTPERLRHLTSLLTLILAAFGEEAGLSGSRSALARAAMFDDVRRFVRANLGDSTLSPESIIDQLGLSRPTIYRLFQHEGGLGAYLQGLRLRAAAAELVRYPSIPIKDVGYAFGFGSASAFTRAFRRSFDLAPQDLRQGETPAARLDRSDWVE
ncbi:AraC family transcriptional regulator [Paraburkholderia acidisoli]|uniref:Helix-turn-helix domain-containing protein n=1 Tax=Paraburkholderia acidisoli TaxID=2571748 RepID=A0A7Z2JJN4_9BURK|nr:AraC family transcriptional regulator [Paraburkholderia acidisoli]QGZ65484.1 helix-turn-helix domain-containing protein [Paraburkholderia acidisoli]